MARQTARTAKSALASSFRSPKRVGCFSNLDASKETSQIEGTTLHSWFKWIGGIVEGCPTTRFQSKREADNEPSVPFDSKVAPHLFLSPGQSKETTHAFVISDFAFPVKAAGETSHTAHHTHHPFFGVFAGSSPRSPPGPSSRPSSRLSSLGAPVIASRSAGAGTWGSSPWWPPGSPAATAAGWGRSCSAPPRRDRARARKPAIDPAIDVRGVPSPLLFCVRGGGSGVGQKRMPFLFFVFGGGAGCRFRLTL